MQTRHTFATLMLSEGENIGWVQNMLGHGSLQMIFTKYYSWIPRKTRNDGAAFMAAYDAVGSGGKEPEERRKEKVADVRNVGRQKNRTSGSVRKSLKFLVAGRGFEPLTFGL
ncbi:MAG: hypothetical protein WCA04_03205 [Geobacteraceae bacterium]